MARRIRRIRVALFSAPTESIGACQYCGNDVTYADGDKDQSGGARHDSCERDRNNLALASLQAGQHFTRAVSYLGRTRSDKERVEMKGIVSALPEGYGPSDMLSVLRQLEERFASGSEIVREAIARLRELAS